MRPGIYCFTKKALLITDCGQNMSLWIKHTGNWF